MTRIAICAASSTSGPDFSVVRRVGGKRQDEGVGHGQDAGTASSTLEVLRLLARGLAGGTPRNGNRKGAVGLRPRRLSLQEGPVPRLSQFHHLQGGPFGSPIRGYHPAGLLTRVSSSSEWSSR